MDVAWTELWLPIIVAAVLLQIASTLLWAVLPWHKPDIQPLPDQAAFDAAVKPLGLKPGFYLAPCTHDGAEYKSEAFQKRYSEGPWMSLNVYPSKPNMGKNMALTFLVFLVACGVIGWVLSEALPAGTEYLRVFRVATACGVLAFVFGGLPNDIWFGKPTRWCVTGLIDAVIYALLAAGAFAAFWPEAGGIPALPTP
ncbi:MAG: hypothetical protein RIB60_09830 [Phycisphaerales bacterium]